jgi:hypothetical protein
MVRAVSRQHAAPEHESESRESAFEKIMLYQ